MGRIAGIVVITAILAVVAPGRFGGGDEPSGPLRWQDSPRTSALGATPGDRLLFGHVVNGSDRPERLRAADVHVLDGDGDSLQGSAAFADGFVPGVTLRGSESEMFGAADLGADVGSEVVLAPGQSAPLSVSFTTGDGQRAATIEYGGGRLVLK